MSSKTSFSAQELNDTKVLSTLYFNVKVKQYIYRYITEPEGSQISRQTAYKCGKVVRPTHHPTSPDREYSWYSFLLEAESTPGP